MSLDDQVDWVPESDGASSTFSRVFAASSAFSRADAVGVHLQVETLRDDTLDGQKYAEMEQLRLDVEENVRALLEESLPEMTAALQLQRGGYQPSTMSMWLRLRVDMLKDLVLIHHQVS
jgi:hypothetical protein